MGWNRQFKNSVSKESSNATTYKRYRSSVKGRYALLKYAGKRRSLEVSITLEQYQDVIQSEACHYCSSPLPTAGSGIDRIDRRIGYLYGNCIACCRACNTEKGRLECFGFPYRKTISLLKESLAIRREPVPDVIQMPSPFGFKINQTS